VTVECFFDLSGDRGAEGIAMYSGGVFPLEGGESDAVVPKGDEGEQLIANVLLAVMTSQLYSDAAAKGYIDQACALANTLARRSITYRPSQLSKFARLTLEVDGQIETLLVSVIDGVLVVPRINSAAVKANLLPSRHAIKLADVELIRFVLRIRTRRVVAVLESLRTAMSHDRLVQAAQYVIAASLHHERSTEPLDGVSDFFAIAHDLVGKRNYPLAALLLNNAVNTLDSYLSSTQVDGHRAVVYSMKGKIGRLLKEIMQTAA
jgi:hypothetical protein